LQALASSRDTLAVRAAALFTLKQLEPGRSNEFIASLVKEEDLREFVLRALCDRKNDANVPAGPFVQGLSDPNPRVRLMAAWGLGRLNKRDAAGQMLPLVADADPLVAHVAINALVSLDAGAAALRAIDPSTAKLVPGAVRVLQELHETQVVDGLVERLKSIQDPAIRGQVYRGLCRLYYREADWTGDWWGTRPDTSGPYFKTAPWEGTGRVESALKSGLAGERPKVLKELVVQMQKNKVDVPELSAALRRIIEQDPSFKGVLIDLAGERQNLGAEQIAMLASAVAGTGERVELRVKALRVLQKNARGPEALTAAIGAIASIPVPATDKALADAVNDFLRDSRLAQQLGALSKIAESDSGARREVVFTVLVNLSSNKLLQKDQRAQRSLGGALDRVWGSPGQAVALLATIGRMRAVEFEPKVKSLTADKNAAVATAAKETLVKLSVSSTPTTNVATAALIEKMPYEQVVAAAIKDKGNAALGKELFTKQGCVQCHTTSAQEPPKGPFLGGIAKRYSRAELCESILKPSAKISQGFETQWFKDADGEMYEGFVTRDAGDEIELRNILGVTSTLKKSDIKERGKRDISVMPEGLVAKLTVHDLASVLAYLESLGG
jgi:putative heme-binding domain-containing protein